MTSTIMRKDNNAEIKATERKGKRRTTAIFPEILTKTESFFSLLFFVNK